MNDPIEPIVKKTQRYWYVDGLADLAFAGVLLIFALYLYPVITYVSGTAAALALGIGQPLVLLITFLAANRLVSLLKERITYPRTGYIRYKKRKPSQRMKKALTAGIAAFAVAIVVNLSSSALGPRNAWILTGSLLAAAVSFLALRFGVLRFFWVGVAQFALGILLSRGPFEQSNLPALFILGMGLIWLVSGAVTLTRYLTLTQPMDAEDEVQR